MLYAGDPAYGEELANFMKLVVEVRRWRCATGLASCVRSCTFIACSIVPCPSLQFIVAQITELATAAAGGDARAKAVQLELLPELLGHSKAILDVNLALTGSIEQLCLALKALAAEHPALKATIAKVKAKLTAAASAGAASTA